MEEKILVAHIDDEPFMRTNIRDLLVLGHGMPDSNLVSYESGAKFIEQGYEVIARRFKSIFTDHRCGYPDNSPVPHLLAISAIEPLPMAIFTAYTKPVDLVLPSNITWIVKGISLRQLEETLVQIGVID
jgi:hypothetical protein